MSKAIAYYDWVFFGDDGVLATWIEKTGSDTRLQSLDDYFRLCLELVEKNDLTEAEQTCFKEKMWKKGYKRLAVGLRIETNDTVPRMITFLDKHGFVDEESERFPYTDIHRITTIPEQPKYGKNNIKVGDRIRLVNKKFTGNIYTVTATHKHTFDAVNGTYKFSDLDYGSISKILPKKTTTKTSPVKKNLKDEQKEPTPEELVTETTSNKPTTTMCVKVDELRKKGYKALDDWMADPNNLYVGRKGRIWITEDKEKRMFHYKQSKWANPYKVGKKPGEYPLEESLRLYKQHLTDSGLVDDINELDGLVLGCFCIQTDKCLCHAQILAKMANKK